MNPHVSSYLDAVESALRTGDATEHSHRPALKALLEGLYPEFVAMNEPRRIACGAPDLVVSREHRHGRLTVGHIEAKDVGVAGGLDAFERSEQGERYRAALPNLIATDYLRFRLYDDGERKGGEVILAEERSDMRLAPVEGGEAALLALLDSFFVKAPVHVTSPRELAERLARLAHLIRDVIASAFEADEASITLRDLRRAFSEVLLPRLSIQDFADMFAQTLAYGMFAARINHPDGEPFDRRHAAFEIPRTNPFLAHLFAAINGPDLDDEPFIGLADDLAQLLADTDVDSVLRHFGERGRRQDPVVHFYETFLAAYDPQLREARGVYYTPEPVVSYIVRSVDELLRSRFGRSDGLADTSTRRGDNDQVRGGVMVLDPAAGTGTFLYGIVDHIREQLRDKGDAGKWSGYVTRHLLPRIFGFELLMAPYAVAHLKLGLQLAGGDLPEDERSDWRYELEADHRLGVFLTNTLEEAVRRSDLLLGAYISDEANLAAEIKRDRPIMVVLGNPPYSGHSANRGRWIREQVQNAYVTGVKGLDRPAQAKWLQDDYVKFIRFGQWRIERSGAGILAFITNHAYLDNPTFRGMRASLLQTFSEIFILDLHGNANRRERAPDGGQDANVFDIKQGVSIALFVRREGHEGTARVYRADLFGARQAKYEWLESNDRTSTPWTEIEPGAPLWLFTQENPVRREEFYAGTSVATIFGVTGDPAPGIVTTHDEFAISWSRDDAIRKVEQLLSTSTKQAAERYFRLCSQRQWSYEDAKDALAASQAWRERITPVDFRPFDQRMTVWDRHVAVHRRLRVSRHMLDGTNLSLVTVAQVAENDWNHALVSRRPIDARMTTSNRGIAFQFPLYLLPWGDDDLDRPATETLDGLIDERKPNLDRDVMAALSQQLRMRFRSDGPGDLRETFGPEDVFHYVYAILNAPSYRERYRSFLKYDFPYVPLDVDASRFAALAAMGEQLVALHLLEAPLPRHTSFPVPGDNVVAEQFPRFVPAGERDTFTGEAIERGRVYINPDRQRPARVRGQFIDGVSLGAWNFEMGGYHVLRKWLSERRSRVLELADIERFEQIVATIEQTILLRPSLDELVQDLWANGR